MQFDIPENDPLQTSGIIPFGKYKGQPIEVLAQDDQYRDWLMSQDWFRSRFPQLVQIVVNNFGTPAETPEHNQMQARFLDEEWRIRFAIAADKEVREWTINRESYLDAVSNEFKRQSLDTSEHGRFVTERFTKRLQGFAGKPVIVATEPQFESGNSLVDVFFNLRLAFVTECRFSIEIKPTVGDDYPAFLRQMRLNHTRFLLYRSYTGAGVDEATFRRLFRSQGITTVREREVESATIPEITVDEWAIQRIMEGD